MTGIILYELVGALELIKSSSFPASLKAVRNSRYKCKAGPPWARLLNFLPVALLAFCI